MSSGQPLKTPASTSPFRARPAPAKRPGFSSLLANALAQGSGFVLVDGKADRDLFGKVLGLARRFGRDDDVRVLNFMVASGLKDSHSFNAFATGNADAIRELLGEPARRAAA